MPQTLIDGLKAAALSPYAFVGYVIVVVAWAYVVAARSKLRQFADDLKQLPEADRWRAVQKRYNVFPKEGLAAEDYLRSRRQLLLFLAFLSIVVAIVLVVTVAMTQQTQRQQVSAETSTDWQMERNTSAISEIGKGIQAISEATYASCAKAPCWSLNDFVSRRTIGMSKDLVDAKVAPAAGKTNGQFVYDLDGCVVRVEYTDDAVSSSVIHVGSRYSLIALQPVVEEAFLVGGCLGDAVPLSPRRP